MLADLSILVVEDDEFQRQMLVDMLTRLKAPTVYAAADGQKAFDLMADLTTPVDVIISDIEMPTMDGLEFVRRMGEAGYRTSVILASAIDPALLASAEAMAKAYGMNLLGAISKPVRPAALEELLARHVAMPRENKGRPAVKPSFSLEEILDGLAENEFEPFFQPKVDVASRRVIGAEALARWRHPRQGIVLPEAFLNVLEESGHIDELMWTILRKSVAFWSTLNKSDTPSAVAVNVSRKSLSSIELAPRVAEIVQNHHVSAERVCLEITESTAGANLGAALENLTRLRLKGFGLSIDDFGTAYSSMHQITHVPLSELKIARAIVANAVHDDAAKVILKSCVQVARELEVKAVAQGVETQAAWDLLQELGCDYAQGFFIAKPMDAQAYVAWLEGLESDPISMFLP